MLRVNHGFSTVFERCRDEGFLYRFCQYRGDGGACRRSLVAAYRKGSLAKHCIFAGLATSREQCREVLVSGLREDWPDHFADGADTEDFRQACKQVVLVGYQRRIPEAQAVLYSAFHRLVRYIIEHRFRLVEDGQPSADDVFQQTWADIHERFSKGICVKRCLATYIAAVTARTAGRLIRKAHQHKESRNLGFLRETAAPFGLIPSPVVEAWEEWDYRLCQTDQGNLINRTILGYLCVDGWSTEKSISAEALLAHWRRLEATATPTVYRLYASALRRWHCRGDVSPARVVAEMINAGVLEFCFLAVPFLAATGLEAERCREITVQMAGLSRNAVYARLSRLRRALRIAVPRAVGA